MSLAVKRKAYLAKLKKEDPEFYEAILASGELQATDAVEENHETDSEGHDEDGESEDEEGGESGDEEDESGDEGGETGDDEDESEDESLEDDVSEAEEVLRESDVDDLYDDEDDVSEKKPKKESSVKVAKKAEVDDDDDNDDDASEGEDDESAAATGAQKDVTSATVELWETQLAGKTPRDAFLKVSRSLIAVAASLNSATNKETQDNTYVVKSSAVCDELVRIAMQCMTPALRRMLGVDSLTVITASKHFKKHAKIIKVFLQNVLVLYDCLTNPALREDIVRTCVLPLLACYKVHPKQCRTLVRKLVVIWATGHKKIRVLATLALFKMIKMMDEALHDFTVKTMYMNYVKNCMFTSSSTVDCIYFMRVSLSELYSLNHAVAYRHMFVFLRQQATILRNAIIANKKEIFQQVLNWQFVHSLHLWCSVLSQTHPSSELQPLIHPLVEVAFGLMHVQISPRYSPLILRVCDMLTELAAATGCHVPVMAPLLQVFCSICERKCKKSRTDAEDDAAANWKCVLKLSTCELTMQSTMKKLLIETAQQIVRYLTTQAHRLAFPEVVAPAVIMLKKCKDTLCPGLVNKLISNIQSHATFVGLRRQKITFSPVDTEQVQTWEANLKSEGELPIVTFYEKMCITGSDVSPWWSRPLKRKTTDQQRKAPSKKSKLNQLTTVKKVPFSSDKMTNASEKVTSLSLADLI